MNLNEAVDIISSWYRYGDRYICVTRPVFDAYAASIVACRYISGKLPEPDKFGRVFLAYKAAIVYTEGR